MALETPLAQTQKFGAAPIFPYQAGYGAIEARLQEAGVTGQAVSYRASTTAKQYLDFFLVGSASARPEFFGVLSTDGPGPTFALPATTIDGGEIRVQYRGVAKLALAFSQTIVAGDLLEPVWSGAERGYWKKATGPGTAQAVALESVTSTGSLHTFISAELQPGGFQGAGLWLQSYGTSTITDTASETAFSLKVTIPAYSLRTDGNYMLVAGGTVTTGNANDTLTIRSRVASVTGAIMAQSPAVDVTNAGVDQFSVQYRFRYNNDLVYSSGTAGISPGQATAAGGNVRAIYGGGVIDHTADQDLLITAQWSAADAANIVVMREIALYVL